MSDRDLPLVSGVNLMRFRIWLGAGVGLVWHGMV